MRRGAIALLCAVIAGGCDVAPAPGGDVNAWRVDKDRFMRESNESPVAPDARAAFPPLVYFPEEPSYRVPAALTAAGEGQGLELPTSTGQRRKMRRVGALRFSLSGNELTLTAFVDATENDMRRLFVPFGDITNGNETYPGGRYLDLDRTATGIYDLDFNRAYHPFCVYNATYDCPYPPRENRLAVPVRAGERLPKRQRIP
ncbi:MAG: DUF1684 domain-containing protein [Vicinamibacterales bacterium]